jgi:hypothetical protein
MLEHRVRHPPPHRNGFPPPAIFFGTILIVVSVGAFVPVLFGGETRGQLEIVTEPVAELAGPR